MSAHSQPRFTAYLGETTNQFSDKQSIRSNQCGSELSGVAQNLHQFLQNNMVVVQPTRVGMFDAQPSTYSSGTGIPEMHCAQMPKHRLNQDLEEEDYGEDRIARYPLKRANSTLDDIRGPHQEQIASERPANRTSSNKPPGSKTVRFDIRESLKNIIHTQESNGSSGGDNNDENDPKTLNQQFLRQSRKQRVPKGQLRFKRNAKRSPSGDKNINKGDTTSGESNTRSSEGQKPRKLDAKTRQLALKYKKSADQMKFKKFGIQPPLNYPDQSTYSTIENPKLLNEDESRETPNFSLAISKKDLTEDTNSTPMKQSYEEIPQPAEANHILMHFPSSLEFEDINHLSYDTDKQIGTIVKSNQVVLPQQRINALHQAVQIRENSTNSSRMSQFQPGMIVRQRSQSPAVSSSFQFSNLASKQNEQKISNIGQIVRTNSQQALLTTKTLPHLPVHHIPTSPDKPYVKKNFQENSSRLQESPSIQINLPYPSNPPSTLSDSTSKLFKTHFYGTLWDHFLLQTPSQAKLKLMQLLDYSSNLQASLHSALTHPQLSSAVKLQCLRRTIPQLVFTDLSEDIEQLIYLKERREQRIIDYRKALKVNDSQFGTLKAQLLKDICDRLTQKVVVMVLKLNAKVHNQMVQLFERYYNEYIAKESARRVIGMMKVYLERTAEQREYLMNVKQELKTFKLRQILSAWYQLKPRRIQQESKFDNCVLKLQNQLAQRCYKQWLSFTISSKVNLLNHSLCETYIKHKYRLMLFLRWTYQRRSHSKIKRKALQILAHHEDHHSIATLSDDQWFNEAKIKETERFKESIAEITEERDHLKKRFSIKKKKVVPSVVKKVQQNREYSSGGRIQRRVNHPIMVEDQIDVNRSMDLDLKYKIHTALVMQQNSSNKQRASSQQREVILPRKQLNYSSFVSDGENFHSVPSSSQNRSSSQQFRTKNPIALPPYFFKKMGNQTKSQQTQRLIQYDHTNPADMITQQQENSSKLMMSHIVPFNHHFVVSLRANAHDVLNPDSFTGLTDYIQYGLASRFNRLLFQRLFRTKVQSVLFCKWRERFQKKRYLKSLAAIHAGHTCKQVLVEWLRTVKQKKIWVREFQRTKTIQRFYRIFQKWATHNREIVKKDRKEVVVFQKKTIIKAWLKYLNRQGNQLMSILKGQQYHRQSLLSRSLVALYQHHLKEMRVRNFRSTKVFKKFFSQKWRSIFKKRLLLRKLLSKLQDQQQLSERMKYQREYEAKQVTFTDWKLTTQEKKEAIQRLTADTHYRQTLVIKTFFNMKKTYQASIALRKLSGIVSRQAVKPSFDKIYESFSSLVSSENQFKSYRKSFKMTKLFMGWKELAIRTKLCKLFYKKLILKHLYTYVQRRNYQLPAQYRARRLQALFLSQLTHEVRAHWQERRSDIILRQLNQKRKERMIRVCYLKLLENVVANRNHRLIRETVRQFRGHKLCDKVMRILKRRWLKRKRDKLMLQVAEDFSQQRQYKKHEELKESLLSSTNDFEIVRLRNHQVFEDPTKMLKYRVLNSWKMFIFDRQRRHTLFDRYQQFKRRMMILRCFLGWHSVAKYEHSSQGQMSGTQGSNSVKVKRKYVLPHSVSEYVTREHSPQREYQGYHQSVEVDRGSGTARNAIDTRQFLFDNRLRSQQESIGQPASATFGIRSIGSNYDSLNEKRIPIMIDGDTPRDCQLRSTSIIKEQQFNGTSSLFDELESIFQKNRKWLDEQREREEFLREMASHYNQQLSLEMNSLKGSSIATSVASRQR